MLVVLDTLCTLFLCAVVPSFLGVDGHYSQLQGTSRGGCDITQLHLNRETYSVP